VFLSLFAIFSSNLLVNKGSSQGLGDFLDNLFDDNDNGDDIKKKIEKELKDKDKDNKQETEKEENFATKDYNFADEGEKERKSFNFAVAGDFGCSKNAKNTVSNMKDKKPELVIPLVDLSYSISANCWLDLISPFNDRLKVTLGYHDVNDGASKLNQYEQTFGLKKHYDSFDYRRVHFVIMSSLSKFDKGSEQYMFISEDLKKASEDKEIDWIIVTSYSPLYTSPSKHTAEKDMRDIYHPLFEQYGVDLVLQAHNHNYQRTYPISYNSGDSSKPTISNQFTTGYSGQSDGMFFQ
jgi:calcineurin-like phosphoesterase family protein